MAVWVDKKYEDLHTYREIVIKKVVHILNKAQDN